MSERIAVLKDGRLHQFDTPEILYTNPRDLFVAEFVGGSNFLDGRLLAKNGSEGIVELQGGARVVGTRAEASESKPDVGDPVRLAVRAEQVVTSIHVDGDHQLVGTLRERIFMGPVVANVIDLAGGVTITARSPTGMAGARHCAGDALALEWRAEDARIYRQDNRTEPAELDSSPPVETDSSLASHSS